MKIESTTIFGAYRIDADFDVDERGFTMMPFNQDFFADQKLNLIWHHQLVSRNRKVHTLRGLHYQSTLNSEIKLVRCSRGHINDILVDMRRPSATYGRSEQFILKGVQMIYVPPGVAHGYLTMEPDTEVSYLISEPYRPEQQSGILWNDPTLGLNWGVTKPIISDRDANLPLFQP